MLHPIQNECTELLPHDQTMSHQPVQQLTFLHLYIGGSQSQKTIYIAEDPAVIIDHDCRVILKIISASPPPPTPSVGTYILPPSLNCLELSLDLNYVVEIDVNVHVLLAYVEMESFAVALGVDALNYH